MSRPHRKFRTPILVAIAGIEHEWPATVIYACYPGFAGSRTDPPEEASVEIVDIKLLGEHGAQVDLPEQVVNKFAEDEHLLDLLMQDWAEDKQRAAEYRAEAMAEARWERQA